MTAPQLIAKENVPMIWPMVGPRLQSAIDKLEIMEYSLRNIRELLDVGQAQLWVSEDGEMIAITRIAVFPNCKRLVVDIIEGANPRNYFDHMEYIENWAMMHGATHAESELRPGMEKIARSQGWKRKRVQVFKKLEKRLH